MDQRLTRRRFLRQGLLTALGAGLLSCAGEPRAAQMQPTAQTQLGNIESDPFVERTAPAWEETTDSELHEAAYYIQLDDGLVQCEICFRRCVVAKGERGFCRNKVNIDGRYFSLVYGRPSALQIDPIEKEPAFHFWPGATIFCSGTASCNNRCKFCQNWHLSQRSFEEIEHDVISPENTVAFAKERECDAVSFTYNEPTVFYEHVVDVAKQASRKGMGTLFHTNGGINEQPLAALLEFMDAVTVDLKAFTPEFYRQVSSSELEPVLRTLRQIHRSDAHLEIVNLMIPTLNDDADEVRRMCHWICDTLDPRVPLHFTRFHPAYKLTSLPPTPVATLEKAVGIAEAEGLQYVYVGNVPGHERNSTFCPSCGEIIVSRVHFSVLSLDVVKGKCRFCGESIPGVWR